MVGSIQQNTRPDSTSPGARAIVSSLLAGTVIGVLFNYVAFFVLSLLNPLNLFPGLLASAVPGALLGVFVARRGVLRRKVGRLSAPAAGIVGSGVWLGLYSAVESPPPARFVVVAVLAFAAAGLYLRQAFGGIDPVRMRRDNIETLGFRVLKAALIAGMTVMVAFPFVFMLSMSLRTRAEYLSDPTNLSVNILQPVAELFNGYVQVLTRFNFAVYILNSTGIALLTVLVTLTTGILGAYAVTRLRFPGRRFLSKAILLIYMFPAIVLVIPLYSVFTQLGLRNTRHGLLIVYAAMTIPVALYMLRSYFQTLPADLEEAGMIDGCSRGGVIWRITIPLSGPAIASVGLYVFMIAWNEFLFAFMFLDSPAIFTLSRGMVVLDDMEVPRQFLMAGAAIITVPIMFLFFRFQRYLVGGLTAGSVKG